MLYKTILLYFAIPYYAIILFIELVYSQWRGEGMRFMDSVASISIGMTNILKVTLGIGVTIISYNFMLEHLHLFTWGAVHIWMYPVCFIYLDFMGYWVHRIQHGINFFWNEHIVHHSSEEFHLLIALRQPISNLIAYPVIFLFPLALLGVPLAVVSVVAPVQLFLQFWYHTRQIGRMGWLEKVFITPSHHRVHHAINSIYLDKNFGQILIVWDKMFGTYQPELPELEPVYGVKRPVRSWNPFLINFQHLYLLLTDAWRTESYRDKVRVWFMPVGWRPADVAVKYPIATIDDIKEFAKFDPGYSIIFKVWCFFQMAFTFILLSFFFYRMGHISDTEKLIYGGFVFLSVFSYSSLMDRKPYAVIAYIIQAATGTLLILQTGDWLGMKNIWFDGSYVLIAYFAVSACVAVYFQVTGSSRRQSIHNIGSEA